MIIGFLPRERMHENSVSVDTSTITNLRELLRETSKVLRGDAYSTQATIGSFPTNLAAFTEYVEDWYESNWDHEKIVRFKGVSEFLLSSHTDFLSIVSAIHHAECNILEEKLLAGDSEAQEKLQKLLIVLS